MKTPRLLFLMAVLTVAVFATALVANAQTTPPLTSSASTLPYGGPGQKASNPNHDDEDERDVNITVSLTLSNAGSSALTVDNAAFTGIVTESRFAQRTNPLPITIAASGSASISVTLRVPENLDAVGADLKPIVHNIGTVKFRSGTTDLTQSIGITMQREN